MTREQFDEARKLLDEINLVVETQWFFGNWSSEDHELVLKNPEHHVVNTVNGLSTELKERLLAVCFEYEKELRKRFDQM